MCAHTCEARGQVEGTGVWGISLSGMGQAALSREGRNTVKSQQKPKEGTPTAPKACPLLVSSASHFLPDTHTCMISDSMT